MTETSVKPVLFGFFLSLLCTIAAYYIVVESLLRPFLFLPAVAGFGFLQTIFQLLFFFHLWREPKPRWNLIMLLFMALVVVIIVGGSIWIMYNLDYHMMPEMES